MNQQEFIATGGGLSQADKILELLQSRLDWVGMPELSQHSGSLNIHSRVSDLRRRGCRISQRTERQKDGTNHSFYKLEQP